MVLYQKYFDDYKKFKNFKKNKPFKHLLLFGRLNMMIDKIEIKRHEIALYGELKLLDGEMSKEDFNELLSRLVSWKLGPVMPTRHFEMIYNQEKKEVSVDVYVTVPLPESSESHVDSFRYVFNKLIEFCNLYERELEDISGFKSH